MSVILETIGLACGYGDQTVFKEINLSIRTGEVCALIGPNGAGKSTLLHALDRLIQPQRGKVVLEGKPLESLAPREIARTIALAPQRANAAAWPLTVGDAVSLGRAPHRGWMASYTHEDKQIVRETLRSLDLEPLAERTLSTLSGGEMRRVILARALAQRPRVLLLDEPLTYLDVHYQAELLGRVHRLAHEKGMAVVLTLHDLALVASCADRVALLAEGRLCAWGTAAEVLRHEVLGPIYGQTLEIFPHPQSGLPIVLPKAGLK